MADVTLSDQIINTVIFVYGLSSFRRLWNLLFVVFITVHFYCSSNSSVSLNVSRIPYDVLSYKPPVPADDVIEERVVVNVACTENPDSNRQAMASDSYDNVNDHCILATPK